jgi:hypothetical protein
MEKPTEHNKGFRELLNGLLDGQLTARQVRQLERTIQANPEAMKLYVDTVTLTVGLRKYSQTQRGAMKEAFEQQKPDESAVWQTLANDEKQAPTIKIVKKRNWLRWKPKAVAIRPKEQNIERVHRNISRIPIVTLIVSTAALVFLLLYIRLLPSMHMAKMNDSVQAVWDNSGNQFREGNGLLYPVNRPQTLKEGFAQVQFASGVQVVFEAPCQFMLESQDQFFLKQGKVFVKVPKEAIGFAVRTPNSRIIDLGTEFGVTVAPDGVCWYQMFVGRASVIAGLAGHEKVSELLMAGQAFCVEAAADKILVASFVKDEFVQHISSNTNSIWRGQKTFDLADIAGGGDGLGTGTTIQGINPITGKMEDIHGLDRITSNAYRTLPDNPFIDGVFVPDGKTTQIISSQGHRFEECPVTPGNFYTAITNTPRLDPLNRWSEITDETDRIGNSFLLMHANNGITFDLNAIRSSISGAKIGRFNSRLYMCQTAPGQPNGDFWVLVDGKLRYSKRNVTQKGFVDSVTIELHDKDRFLTLVTTDGGDIENRTLPGGIGIKSIYSDWAVFADPVIELTTSNTNIVSVTE